MLNLDMIRRRTTFTSTSPLPTGEGQGEGFWTMTSVAIALLVLAASPAARAQPAPNPGLPSLTPRVFTSTGPARVNLPAIQRQPISGFGPPPRQYVVPAERVPVVEPFEPPVEALPPFEIAAPAEPALRARTRRSFRAEAAAGSQFGRSARLDFEAAGESGLFFVDGDFDGVSGSSEYVHSDRLTVRAGGQSYAAGRLRLDGIVSADTYSLPGAAERRTRFAAGTTVGASGVGRVPFDARVGFTQSRVGGGGETSEGRVDGAARVGLARDAVRLDAAAGVSGAGFGDATASSGGVQYGSAGSAFAIGRPDGARLVIGVRGMAVQAADAGGRDAQAVGPILDARFPLSGKLVVFATNAPHLEVRSLGAVALLNPYLASGTVVAPDVLPVDARAGVEVASGRARVRLYGLGTVSPARLVFQRIGAGFFGESYLKANTAGVGADVTFGDPDALSASAGVEARRGRTDGGGRLPFYAPVVARAALASPFNGGRGRAGLTVQLESARPDDTTGQIDAPAFALVGFDARYDLGRGPFALVARAERLVGSVERWPGFPEPPFTVQLGLRLSR